MGRFNRILCISCEENVFDCLLVIVFYCVFVNFWVLDYEWGRREFFFGRKRGRGGGRSRKEVKGKGKMNDGGFKVKGRKA